VGIGKASVSEPLTTCRKGIDDIETGAGKWCRDEPGGVPLIGQAVSGMEAARVRSAASTRNVGRQVLVLPPGSEDGLGGERERVARRKS
jgi:hypothetical protein